MTHEDDAEAMTRPAAGGSAAERVTVISVCYNSQTVLPAMLASIPAGAAIVLVDNGSEGSDEVASLAARFGATLVANRDNRGFGPACNQGARLAVTEFLLFLNPDAHLAPGCLDALVTVADRHREAVAFSPAISSADGTPYFKRGSVLLPRSHWLSRGWPSSDREVPVLSGAALFVRRADFEAVGGFDEAIFLYHEDDDLSLRLAATRGTLWFVHGARVAHAGGRSSPRSPRVAAAKAWHMGRSRVYAARKHGHRPAFAGALAQALVQLLSPALIISRRKRAKQLAFLRGVWSMRRPTAEGG